MLPWVALAFVFAFATRADASPAPQPYGSCAVTSATVTNPAAGSNNFDVITVPAGHYYDLAAVRMTFATANAGGTRAVNLRMLDASGNQVWLMSVNQAINTSQLYDVADGGYPLTSVNETVFGLPKVTMQPGWKLRWVISAGLNAADQFSGTVVTYCDGTSANAPTETVHVDNPQTSVTVSNPQTSVTVSNPVTAVTVNTASPHVIIDNPEDISGASGCSETYTTSTTGTSSTTTTTEVIPACVVPVRIAEGGGGIWIAVLLVVLAFGFVFGVKFFNGR